MQQMDILMAGGPRIGGGDPHRVAARGARGSVACRAGGACAGALAIAPRSPRRRPHAGLPGSKGGGGAAPAQKCKALVLTHGEAEAQADRCMSSSRWARRSGATSRSCRRGRTWACRSAAQQRVRCGPHLWPSGGRGRTSWRACRALSWPCAHDDTAVGGHAYKVTLQMMASHTRCSARSLRPIVSSTMSVACRSA